ncbi:MAG: hypothetical protein JXJ17_00520 [Anaerolineae bacterium]|nr:hypothetical protein [Anaerolineae bacterium]
MDEKTFSIGTIYQPSLTTVGNVTYFLIRLHNGGDRLLGVVGGDAGFQEPAHKEDDAAFYPLTAHNAAELRRRIDRLNPVPLGIQTSFGFGDRLGVATPGHIEAMRASGAVDKVAPIFAQQSVRENTRTGRTPQQVMDAATWGIFQEGWTGIWGADADHVKEISDLKPFVEAGYTFYTIDPSEYVDNDADSDDVDTLKEKVMALPWEALDSSYADMESRYCLKPVKLDGLALEFDEEILLRALAKYGRALAHTVAVAQELASLMQGGTFDLEMSVDETDTPTSIHEHYFIANELARCAVPVVSVAPRFVGKFQKGVDYIGDVDEFEREFEKHVAIMLHFGTYKISIHTGSDKFSIYPVIARYTQGQAHVKTAGTSYLEVLRVMSRVDPALFRQVLDLGHERFETDRKSYFVDCQPSKVPAGDQLPAADLPGLLDQFDSRQLLHVTFGSVLDVFGEQIFAMLADHADEYRAALAAHFRRHIEPFL